MDTRQWVRIGSWDVVDVHGVVADGPRRSMILERSTRMGRGTPVPPQVHCEPPMLKRVALPHPPRARQDDGNEAPVSADARLKALLARREDAAAELGRVEAEIDEFAAETICGDRDDSQHVEKYDGSLGVTRQFVLDHEKPVGQLQWNNDLAARFSGPGADPGNVNDVRWGSGTLLEGDLFLTAGHCFDASGGGWRRPMRGSTPLKPAELAVHMHVNFSYQVNGSNGTVRAGVAFPVAELLEWRFGGLDYAIARLGKNQAGRRPSEVYPVQRVAASDARQGGTMLCIIQHPNGNPKMIEAGPLFRNDGHRIEYDSLDTLGGSSGSGILSPDGHIAGVHTNGGCTSFSGANFGVAIGAIRTVSQLL